MSKSLAAWPLVVLLALAGCKGGDSTSSSTTSGASVSAGTAGSTSTPPSTGSTATSESDVKSVAPQAQEVVMSNGIKYVDMKVGDGALAERGMTATVHYTGWLTDGTEFDSSLRSGQPLSFRLGAGRVIQGWEEGIAGMRVGGQRKLTIPPDLAYGAAGYGGVIPPNATLVFEVQLLGVR